MLKAFGYVISSISVVLLGVVAWDSAAEKPALLACLALGMTASVVGMAIRLKSHLNDKAQREREHQPDLAPR